MIIVVVSGLPFVNLIVMLTTLVRRLCALLCAVMLLAAAAPTGAVDQVFEGFSMKDAQKVLEKAMITKALKATEGNRTHAARLLEISHPSLLSKIKRYKIEL